MAAAPGFVSLSGGRMVAALLVGMALGLWLEVYRGHLREMRPRRVGLLVRDLVFWIMATLIAAFGLYFANWLDLRLYAVCAMALGILLASALAGPTVRPGAALATRVLNAGAAAAAGPFRALARRRRGRPDRTSPPTPPTPPDGAEAGAAAVRTRRDSSRRWWERG